MDKVLSTRIDEFVVREIGDLAHRLHTSKKQIIEQAIRQFAQTIECAEKTDVLKRTRGAWKRPERTEKTIEETRRPFRASMNRHHR